MIDPLKIKYLYRYEDSHVSCPYRDRPSLFTFTVIRETPYHYIIEDCWRWAWHSASSSGLRRVRKEGKNIYAWDTKKKAMFNYMKRKEKQVKILESRLADAEANLKLAQRLYESGDYEDKIQLLTFEETK